MNSEEGDREGVIRERRKGNFSLAAANSEYGTEFLSRLEEKESRFEWEAAAELCAARLAMASEKPSEGYASTVERLAVCHFNFAFQSNTREEFKQKMLRARDAYDRAGQTYEKLELMAIAKKCRARSQYARYFLSEDADERRAIIGKCLELAKEAAGELASKDASRIASSIYLDLETYFRISARIASDPRLRQSLISDYIIWWGEFKAHLDDTRYPDVFIDHAFESLWMRLGIIPDEVGITPAESRDVAFKVSTLLNHVKDPRYLSLAKLCVGWVKHDVDGDPSSAVAIFEEAASLAEATRDSLLVGRCHLFATYSDFWAGISSDTLEERRRFFERGSAHSAIALERMRISLTIGLVFGYNLAAECHTVNSLYNAQSEQEKRKELEMAIEIAREGLPLSMTEPSAGYEHALSKALYFYAMLHPNTSERKKILSEAMTLRQSQVARVDTLVPNGDFWDRGVYYNYLSSLKAELSELTENSADKIASLRQACEDMEKCFVLCMRSPDARLLSFQSALAFYYVSYGDTLTKLFKAGEDRGDAMRAIEQYGKAVNLYQKANRTGIIPTVTWKIAMIYDEISENEKASAAFAKASEEYRSAANKQRSLQRTFSALSSYMDAWFNIEKARLLHKEGGYQEASDRYTRAARSLETSGDFAHLAKHYLACSKIEEAEELGRKERHEESSKSFEDASALFKETAEELAAVAEKDSYGSADIKKWSELSRERSKYAMGRRGLEDALVHDSKGETTQAMRKFRDAAETFAELVPMGTLAHDSDELQALALSCEAWATMKEAENKLSPELYSKAANLFMKAKEKETSRKFLLSCLANSALCRAFEAGTKFKLSRDTELYGQIKKQLEAAAGYYEEGGFETAVEWTRATEALFDALAYLANAEGEMDPAKKAQMYHLAEKHLELSARRYGEIGNEIKREEVQKQLRRARENRELLLTPMEALSQNPVASVTPVNFTRDQALGLEKFEVANITGNMSISANKVDVGSHIRVDIEVANIGKTPALLMKLNDVMPMGFRVVVGDTPHHLVGGDVDLKGKRLEYLKTHEIALVLEAQTKGEFELKPKLLFVDDGGKFRSYEFEPTKIEVKELGLTGWIKKGK